MTTAIYVTQPTLAPLEEFREYLDQIWRTGVMTHNGPLMQRLERELCEYLHVRDTVCLANGTLAMQLAIRAFDLRGEIITTPFSFIATANAIQWEHCTPVFVDIDPGTWNIDPDRIEAAVTKRTVGILPVHVFSAPCAVDRIAAIADCHGLRVIYDAAHAMCVTLGGRSIMDYGDVACTSFHATKIFNTCEGGACFARDPDVAARIRRLRFFGFDEGKEVVDVGTNAKMTEIAAGLGLANLRHLPMTCHVRRAKYELYRNLLQDCPHVTFQSFVPESYNYSYMPVLFDKESRLMTAVRQLNARDIYPRRYFHPSLHECGIFATQELPVAESIARRILCLPLYTALTEDDIRTVARIVSGVQEG